MDTWIIHVRDDEFSINFFSSSSLKLDSWSAEKNATTSTDFTSEFVSLPGSFEKYVNVSEIFFSNFFILYMFRGCFHFHVAVVTLSMLWLDDEIDIFSEIWNIYHLTVSKLIVTWDIYSSESFWKNKKQREDQTRVEISDVFILFRII